MPDPKHTPACACDHRGCCQFKGLDPAALRELVEAADQLINKTHGVRSEDWARIKEALARVQGEKT